MQGLINDNGAKGRHPGAVTNQIADEEDGAFVSAFAAYFKAAAVVVHPGHTHGGDHAHPYPA